MPLCACHVTVVLALFALLLTTTAGVSATRRVHVRSPGAGAPIRPRSFETSAALDQYLSELRDYYAVLGRPR